MKRLILALGLIVISIGLVACGGAGGGGGESEANTLTAVNVSQVSMNPDASIWADAPALTVPTVGSTDDRDDGPDITVQAVYDGDSIAIRAEWADSTESIYKNAWTWDGSSFTKSGNEDRIMLAFPIGNNPEFSDKGCTAACHNQADEEDEWWMGTEDEAMLYDVWHWKAARTHPTGQADDKWWGTQEDPNDVESSRHGDSKDSGGQTTNANDDGSGPLYMHGTDLSDSFIYTGEEVEIDTTALELGMVVPGYVIEELVGSRGDISVEASWENGKWVVVLMRALDTGHDDDVAFLPPRSVPFGLSIIDDGGGLDHTNGPDVLTLAWEQ